MKVIDIIASALLVIGGLTWGLVGFFDFNLVGAILGEMTIFSRFVYLLVGFAAVYQIAMLKPICTRWDVHFHKPAHT